MTVRKRTILFVCTGNICRSPLAEYLLRARLDPSSGWMAASAGLAAIEGLGASDEAVNVAAERGVDLHGHASRPVREKDIASAALVVVMTASHAQQLGELFPQAVDEKVFRLRAFAPGGDGDIDDPMGLSLEAYRAARDAIEESLPGLMEFMRTLT
ncbi:MAG: low molecular weight protein arginine phosphatase [Lentisphaerae bacterium]|nr:low molecular weight protein arginine phosphatase [Lentisphaerota bacterium]